MKQGRFNYEHGRWGQRVVHPLQEYKAKQKLRAKMIRVAKQSRKEIPFGILPRHVLELQNEFRVRHIAICEFRGRKREEIERPGPGNELSKNDKNWIKRIHEFLTRSMNEYRELQVKNKAIRHPGFDQPVELHA